MKKAMKQKTGKRLFLVLFALVIMFTTVALPENTYAAQKKYSVTYKLDGGTNNSKNPKNYYKTSKTIKLKNPTKKGYVFKGWYKDAKFKTKVTEIKKGSTGNKKFYAKWARKYKITYNLNGGTNNSKNPAGYCETSTIKLKNPTRTGYTFAGWYKDAKYKTRVTVIKKGTRGNKTFYAKWTANKYTVVYYANGAKTGTMSVSNLRYGQMSRLRANTYSKSGYNFTGWNTKADGKGKTYADKASVKNLTSKANATVKLYAQWEKKTNPVYTITYELNGGELQWNPKIKYSYRTTDNTFPLYDPDKAGYTFGGWYEDADCNTGKVTEIKTGSSGNKKFYAKWIVNKYIIDFDYAWHTGAEPNNEIYPSVNDNYNLNNHSGMLLNQMTLQYDKTYTLPQNKFKLYGYKFVGWKIGRGEFEDGARICMKDNPAFNYDIDYSMEHYGSLQAVPQFERDMSIPDVKTEWDYYYDGEKQYITLHIKYPKDSLVQPRNTITQDGFWCLPKECSIFEAAIYKNFSGKYGYTNGRMDGYSSKSAQQALNLVTVNVAIYEDGEYVGTVTQKAPLGSDVNPRNFYDPIDSSVQFNGDLFKAAEGAAGRLDVTAP